MVVLDPILQAELTLGSPRVFEYAHKQEIKKVKDDGTWGAAQLETIVHPNEYFKRSYLLRNLSRNPVSAVEEEKADIKMDG